MHIHKDNRIVMTLDAGGTNFVFSAISNYNEIIQPIYYPSNAHHLDLCLLNIIKGFTELKSKLPDEPVAISFAFPGPADYPNGIIGELPNLPVFKGGVALGPMLEKEFRKPVFINNDGDLFTYGEAIDGFLPYINNRLEKAGSSKRYNNLFGITLGTGFGAGIVRNGELFLGDNSSAAEIWITRNKINSRCIAEEGASIRSIQRVYNENARHVVDNNLEPKDIYEIAEGKRTGDIAAADKSFSSLAEVVGDALANAISLIDGLITEMNSTIELFNGQKIPRLVQKVYNLENITEMNSFLSGSKREIIVPHSNIKIPYDPEKRIGLGLSKLGTSKAVSIGAYAFAIDKIDKSNNKIRK
jgi:glucokinase